MTNEVALEEKEAPTLPQCRHHWLIESPHGATSWGTCKVCGERREFMNSAQDALWERESMPGSRGEPVVSYRSRVGSSGEDDDGF